MKLTTNVEKIFNEAERVAKASGMSVMPLHVLYGILTIPSCVASKILVKCGITPESIRGVKSAPSADMDMSAIRKNSEMLGRGLGQSVVVSEAVFATVLRSRQVTVTVENIKKGSILAIESELCDLGILNNPKINSNKKNSNEDEKINNNESSEIGDLPEDILRLGYDLTAKVRKGKVGTIIGRDEETRRVIEILSRKTKNNPVLVGEAGVGKSAIIEGLARRIVSGDVPDVLVDNIVFSLEISSLMAGTKFRGELEGRLEKLFKFLDDREDIILFIDEIHTVVNAGGGEGEVGIGEMLKPKLARGQMRTVGATTVDEYKKYIEKDPALERRFAPVMVEPPSPEQSIQILKGLRNSFENFHGVQISDDAIASAVNLSHRYIPDRNLPDKAIDMLDEACAVMKLGKSETLVADEHVARIVAKITGIPVTKLSSSDKQNLGNIEESLRKGVIGQDKAITAISKTIRRARAGIADENRPVGSFMFLGRTGTGKTQVCKELSKILFTTEKAFIRMDMSEFSESHSVSKIIGAPAGYAGYDDGSALCDRVRRNPYCLVLFDEIEKAHPDVYNVMLQILDDGRLTDNKGRVANFKNAVIVFTSNVGVENIGKQKVRPSAGFGSDKDEDNRMTDIHDEEERAMMDGMKKRFKPEFINRIDNVVVFNSLSKSNIESIAKIHVAKLQERLRKINISLDMSDDVVRRIADIGYDYEMGARPLRRALQAQIEDKISEEILKRDDIRNVSVTMQNEKITFNFE